ncbi:hypothetical protein ABC766_24570 [Methylobacterium fujisawaense]
MLDQDAALFRASGRDAIVEERQFETRGNGTRLLHVKKLAVSDEEGRPQ